MYGKIIQWNGIQRLKHFVDEPSEQVQPYPVEHPLSHVFDFEDKEEHYSVISHFCCHLYIPFY